MGGRQQGYKHLYNPLPFQHRPWESRLAPPPAPWQCQSGVRAVPTPAALAILTQETPTWVTLSVPLDLGCLFNEGRSHSLHLLHSPTGLGIQQALAGCSQSHQRMHGPPDRDSLAFSWWSRLQNLQPHFILGQTLTPQAHPHLPGNSRGQGAGGSYPI